jgi:broad specificity phosphatase PhoE
VAVLVELRRHSLTKKGAGRGAGSQLSQEGVALAAREGARGPRFSKVFASPIARTSETAIAMGFAVTDILPELGALEAVQAEVGFHAQWAWEQPFARFREFVERGGASAALGQAILQSIHRAVADVPEGESVLFVSHGSALEIALVTALPDADHASWGRSFSHCEGARLVLEGGAFQLQELLRLPSAG